MAKIQDFSEGEQAVAYLIVAGVYGNWMITPLVKYASNGDLKSDLSFGKIKRKAQNRISPINFYVGTRSYQKNKILNGYHVVCNDAGIDEEKVLYDYMMGKEKLPAVGQKICQEILNKRKAELDSENIAVANKYRWNSLVMNNDFERTSGLSPEFLAAVNEEIGKGIADAYQVIDASLQTK